MIAYLAFIIILSIVLIFIVTKPSKFILFEDGISVKDIIYPSYIQADTIVSVSILDKLPKRLLKSNGANFGRILKGGFVIINDECRKEKATLYIRNSKANVIEIRTANDLIYINSNDDEQTKELFDDINKTLNLPPKNKVNTEARMFKPKRFILVVGLFVVLILLPVFFISGSNEFVVNEDSIEIKGDYSMEIPLSDIDTICLVEQLPSIKLRTNGISTKKVNIGNFRMSDGEKCHLYINNVNKDLFIKVKTSNDLIFINRETAEETKSLFEEMFNVKY